MKELSKGYDIEGFYYGRKEPEPQPFPVKRGTKELKERFGLRGVPSVVVIEEGRLRIRFQGARDIKDASFIIKAFNMGAMTVSEAMDKPSSEEVIITGWLIHKGRYFEKDPGFFITDRQREVSVSPWLPLEAVKSPFKKRPRVMSDLIGRPVVLRGRLIKAEKGYQFIVVQELNGLVEVKR